MAENKGRGWNFRKGAKDVPSVEELRIRAGKGGKTTGRKTGFSDKRTLQTAIEKSKRTRQTAKTVEKNLEESSED